MAPVPYAPLVCPTCGSILQWAATGYTCVLHHHYTVPQLDEALVSQLQQTLQRTVQQLQQRQYLLTLLEQQGMAVSFLSETAVLQVAQQLLLAIETTKP